MFTLVAKLCLMYSFSYFMQVYYATWDSSHFHCDRVCGMNISQNCDRPGEALLSYSLRTSQLLVIHKINCLGLRIDEPIKVFKTLAHFLLKLILDLILNLSPTNAWSQVHGSKRLSCDTDCQEVSRCCTRGESEKSIAHRSQRMQLRVHPGIDTSDSHQGYQWPHKKDLNVLKKIKKHLFSHLLHKE